MSIISSLVGGALGTKEAAISLETVYISEIL